jgi:inorganic triphosphatase YgiF
VRLQARYFDTPDRRLAAAGLALRLRREGRRWVQTLKARGDGLMQRLEHEVVVPGRASVPALDLSRHAGTTAGAALEQALVDSGAALGEIFATDIRRTRRQVRVNGGVVVEIAFDEGQIRAGVECLPVCELEFELLRGPASALPAMAAGWVRRHGLWLDPRSKAQRGERLASGAMASAIKAGVPPLQPQMSADEALRAMLASGLHQALGNACELADGNGTAEHLHQCRIGMRRLRCALRDFGPLASALDSAAAVRWQEELRLLFRRLGGARDRDALREHLMPALLAAGAPPNAELPASPSVDEDAGAVMREPQTTQLWLAILAYVQAAAAPLPGASIQLLPLREQLDAVLRGLHHRIAKDAARYETLDEAAQHRTRKRLKRLRYGAEFCSSLYSPKAVLRYLEVLRPAQDALGDGHDLIVARTVFEPELATNPHVWFVLGWLAAQRPVLQARCSAALMRIAETRGFWGRDAGH